MGGALAACEVVHADADGRPVGHGIGTHAGVDVMPARPCGERAARCGVDAPSAPGVAQMDLRRAGVGARDDEGVAPSLDGAVDGLEDVGGDHSDHIPTHRLARIMILPCISVTRYSA